LVKVLGVVEQVETNIEQTGADGFVIDGQPWF